MAPIECTPIGVVRSPYRARGDAPRQGRLADTVAEIHVFDAYAPGLEDVERSSHLIVLYWLDRAERGFSFMKDGPLDMRMGRSGPTAADLVAELPPEELARVFREYGEEPRAKAVARTLAEARKEAPIRTTGELRRLVTKAVGSRREEGRDPATRVFQALRIATNRELVELERFLDDAISRLSLGARLAVLSYHSLEDRIVKDVFRDRSAGCSCPPSFPRAPPLQPSRIPSAAWR